MGSEPSRRDLLRTGIAGPLGLLTVGPNRSGSRDACAERSIILLLLVGGPSHFETWDPKPDAPAEVRGPFRPIATNVPGVFISEHLPRLSRCVDRLTVIRSLHHESAPIHETGLQLVQTGRVCPGIGDYPHFGSVVARLLGARNGVPPFVVLPHPIGNTGLGLSRGQSAGRLGAEFSPVTLVAEPVCSTEDVRPIPAWARAVLESDAEPRRIPAAYGGTAFGRSCLGARRLVEAGVRVVTVNMYPTVVNRATWDCHGARPFSSFEDYARVVLPTFDRAVSALIRDLEARGLLETTLVLATGEFGRTPRINAAGGRDHWPGVWSAILAGGTGAGGVLGASDASGAEPVNCPLTPGDLIATIYRFLGIDPWQRIPTGDGVALRLVEGAQPPRDPAG